MQEKSKYQLKSSKSPLQYAGVVITLFVFIICNCFGQSITWQRTYDGVDNIADDGFDVCKADGNNIYVSGATTFLPNDKRIYVLKLNPYGDTIWTKIVDLGSSGGELATAITSSADGGCVITGDANFAFSIKLDSEGNIIWNKNYGGFFKQCNDIIHTSDGGYIICGRDGDCSTNCAYVLKIDSSGNLQWQRTYNTPYVKRFYSIVETNDMSGYVIAGLSKSSVLDTLKGLILKIDHDGNVIWEKVYRISGAANFLSMKKLQNGYVAAGNHVINGINGSRIFIAKFDANGDTIYTKSIENAYSRNFFYSFEIINANKYVLSNSVIPISDGPQYGNPILIDSTGVVIRENVYLSRDFLLMRSVLSLPNGDIVFVGTVDFDSIFTKEDIYVLRTDSLLNAPPPIGINTINNTVPAEFRLYQNFPNPFNPYTLLKYEIKEESDIELSLFDINGRLISILEKGTKKIGFYSYKLSADFLNLASGIYFIKMQTNVSFIQTIKIVLIK